MKISNLKTSGQVRLSDQVLDNTPPQVDVSIEGVVRNAIPDGVCHLQLSIIAWHKMKRPIQEHGVLNGT